MAAHQTTIDQEKDARAVESQGAVSFMTWSAWAALIVGILICLYYSHDFSDRNLGLMIGIGCLIGSVQIYFIGAAIRLFQSAEMKRS